MFRAQRKVIKSLNHTRTLCGDFGKISKQFRLLWYSNIPACRRSLCKWKIARKSSSVGRNLEKIVSQTRCASEWCCKQVWQHIAEMKTSSSLSLNYKRAWKWLLLMIIPTINIPRCFDSCSLKQLSDARTKGTQSFSLVYIPREVLFNLSKLLWTTS